MVYSGPQKYPGASTTYWYQGKYGGDRMESNVGVLHTTEGRSVPSYGGGASAPNFTALPDIKNKRLVWYQHFDFDRSSRALVNRSGGVETNTMNAVQVELVGTCDPKYKTSWGSRRAGVDYLFWPDAPDWALKELAKFVKWAHENHGVRLQSLPQSQWRAYPSSYGATSSRLTNSEWLAFYGWCGHQHVPENSHGDPGNLRMDKVLAYAKGEDLADTGGSAVALTETDLHNIWYKDIIPAQPEPYENEDWHKGNKTWTVKYTLYTIVRAGREILDRVKKLDAKVDAVQTPTVDLDALATKIVAQLGDDLADVIADKLSERLKS